MKYVKISFISIFFIQFLFANLSFSQSTIMSSSSMAKAKRHFEKSNDPSFVKVITFEDDMNGNNSVVGLEARGWIVVDADGGGENPAWYQGNQYEYRFNAHEGSSNGYVASDWSGYTNNIVDHWLITPTVTVEVGDVFSFWMRSGSEWDDSLAIYISDNTTTLSSFSFVDYFLVDTLGWVESRWSVSSIPADGKIRFGLRYYIGNIENNGDYIGLDLFQVNSTATGNLPIVTTGSATSIGTTTATLNGTINPNGTTTNFQFQYGTTTDYGFIISPGNQLTGTSPLSVNSEISDLSPNTTYNFRLVANTTNNEWVYGSNSTFTTSDGTSTVDLECLSLSLPAFDWQVGDQFIADLKVRNNGTSASPNFWASLYLSNDTEITQSDTELGVFYYSSIPAGDSSTLPTFFNVPAQNDDIYYVGAIVDVKGEVSESNENNNIYDRVRKIIIGYSDQLQISHSMSFNDPELASSYRMFGLPGNNIIPLSQIFSGTHGEDWAAYHDNGGNENYLVQFDGSATFNLSPGRGFWVLSSNTMNLNSSVSTVQLQSIYTSSQTFELGGQITLHNEWNIISNPFEINADWNSIKNHNGITESLHDFNGTYTNATVMEPYKGYYFYNATNLTQLLIPYSPTGFIPKLSDNKNNSDDNIIISISDGTNKIANVNIGMSIESLLGYDKNDRFIPPGDFEEERISIFNPNLETEYKYLSKDYRNPNKNHVYEIEIKYPIGENYDLVIEGIENIGLSNTYLVGPNANFINLESKSSLQLISSQKINKYTLLIGSDEFIEDQRHDFLPKEYRLSQNYPNPFNPNTRIIFSIPEESFVSLKVYDILGKEIATLLNEKKAAGNYNVNFNGDNLSSGIYFYALSAGKFIETKKMILLQ